ncbi:phosphate signaling complex protein PhoU [Geoalkalibacter subterraneus]|uniref:Phosphate-specific transport system accessory protein PhoU n=1 Tax=Geoalkalibacter subterraneus TaxID=483547 RepID=A0A0B5FTF5_9BACT|nr:phosphate signaling complex protein PhoU [Geoalkalibacter subterraneus]AJF07455.1 PhoU family transcriptional regulator [Geoalkalibacter subterraneus]
MTLHIQREMDRLKKSILSLSAIVEESVQKAVLAVENLDVELARKVMESDDQIDDLEVDLEEECLKILALHQPVANDLRFIIAVLKINNDLERIGDLAGNIAERTIALADEKERIVAPTHFPAMVAGVEEMLKKSLDALVNLDLRLAAQVCRMDDQIDKLHAQTYSLVKQEVRSHPDQLDSLLHYLTISRHLERIADLATNLAEDVIYMIEGDIVRHTGLSR